MRNIAILLSLFVISVLVKSAPVPGASCSKSTDNVSQPGSRGQSKHDCEMAEISPSKRSNPAESAARQIHTAWMDRNPKQDWNRHLHVSFSKLEESEQRKDLEQVEIIRQLMTQYPRSLVESDEQYHELIADKFGALAHEKWREGFEKTAGINAARIKKVSDGSEVNINVPWQELHSEWQRENLEAGRDAFTAVKTNFK